LPVKKKIAESTKEIAVVSPEERKRISKVVPLIGICLNTVLCIFKIFAGVVAHSGAMVSDGVHSASDVFSTIIVMIGLRFANVGADKSHPYGHERFECVAALLLSFVLCLTGGSIGVEGIMKILGSSENLAIPGMLALIAAAVSIVVKEAMYWFVITYAKKINSSALRANAWDNRSDAISSIGSFAGIFGARMGYPKLDAVASVIISLCILKVAYNIFKDSINKMLDHSCSNEFVEEVKKSIQDDPEVVRVDDIKTRLFGDRAYVDVEIAVDGNNKLYAAHEIAKRTHDKIESTYPTVKHCMVHVNPADSQM